MAGKINGLHIRSMTSSDIPGAMFLVESVNWNQTPRDWQMILCHHGTHLVATANDIIVGTICALDYRSFIWVAMVLVHPQFRRQGIATVLLEKILAIHKDRILRLDATQDGASVYEKFGFFPIQKLFRWQISSLHYPATQRQIGDSSLPSDQRQLMEYDHSVFGGDRSAILHWLIKHYPDQCFLIPSKTRPAFLLGRVGTHAWQIGPLVAKNIIEADELIIQLLNRYPDQVFFLDSFASQTNWNRRLEENGFICQRNFIRMQLGSGDLSGDEQKQFAVAGPELG